MRRALENSYSIAEESDSFALLKNFPKHCCIDASEFLAKYLHEQLGIPKGDIAFSVNGEHGTDSHAWLEVCRIIIDITADQFDGQSSPVIVTTDRSWHDRFEGPVQEPFSTVMGFNDHFKNEFDEFYKKLLNSNLS